MRIVDALDAEAVAVDAEGFPGAEAREIEGAGIDFHRDFNVGRKSVVGFEGMENAIDLAGGKKGGGAAAEEEGF